VILNYDLGGTGRKQSWFILIHCLSICLNKLSETRVKLRIAAFWAENGTQGLVERSSIVNYYWYILTFNDTDIPIMNICVSDSICPH
jgi:hypothetical protein